MGEPQLGSLRTGEKLEEERAKGMTQKKNHTHRAGRKENREKWQCKRNSRN